MGEKLIVLSMDAMVGKDVAYLKTKPNFSGLFARCAHVETMCSVYPSLTYPAHVSMMTGCRPGRHGIYNNQHFMSASPYPDWHLRSDEIQVEDIFAAAKRAGKTTASIYWPVTGNNPNIDYLLNEYFFYAGEPIEETFRSMGANEEAIGAVRENLHRFPKAQDPDEHFYLHNTFDHFIMGCMCSMIRNLQPDLLLVHNCWLDSYRHRYGVFHPYMEEALDQVDLWLGDVLAVLEEAGIYDDTNFILVSDHGQRNYSQRVKMNALLRRGGFIDVDEHGSLRDWRAFSKSNAMSVSIHLRDKSDAALRQEVSDYLNALLAEGIWGFSKIRTAEEAREEYGLYGDFSFILETDGNTAFAEGWEDPVVSQMDCPDCRFSNAAHGYEPEAGPQPVFLARGPAIRTGVWRERGRIIDEAPTYARILGDSLPQAEGCVMEYILADGR